MDLDEPPTQHATTSSSTSTTAVPGSSYGIGVVYMAINMLCTLHSLYKDDPDKGNQMEAIISDLLNVTNSIDITFKVN